MKFQAGRKLWMLALIVALSTVLVLSATALDTPTYVAKSNVNHEIYNDKQIIRTSSGRLYYFNGDGGHTYYWDGWVEAHTSPDGSAWSQVASHDQWYWKSGIGVAVDSRDVIHMVTFNWDNRLYYEKFNTLDSAKGDHSWEGQELIESDIPGYTNFRRCSIALDANDVPHVLYQLYETHKGKDYLTLHYANRVGGVWNKIAVWPKENQASFTGSSSIAIGPDNLPYILMGTKMLKGDVNNPAAFEEAEYGGLYFQSFVIHQNGDVRVALYANGSYAFYVHDHTQPWTTGWTLHESVNQIGGPFLTLVNDIPYSLRLDAEGFWVKKAFDDPVLAAAPPTGHQLQSLMSRWSFYNNHGQGVIDMGARSWSTTAGNYYWHVNYAVATIAAFTATPTRGLGPLTVSFTDNSTTSGGRTLVSWAWDFDNNGLVDSTEQNPTFVFNTIGKHTVTLTVTDSAGESATVSKTEYIEVTEDADDDGFFDADDNCPLVYNPRQLDFDGDGIGYRCDSQVALVQQVLHETTLKTETADEGAPSDITASLTDGLFDTVTRVQLGKRGYDVVSIRSNVEAAQLASYRLSLYVNAVSDGISEAVNVYAYNSDGLSVQATAQLPFTLSPGWNTLDLTPLLANMTGFGFIKFRITVPANWLDISEATTEVQPTGGIDTWDISVSPANLDFGATDAGGYAWQKLTMTNIGTGNLVLGNIAAPSLPYRINSDTCSGQTLTASAACSVVLAFAPVTAGTYTDTLRITSNDRDNAEVAVNLTGTARSLAGLIGRVTDTATGAPLPDVTVSVTTPKSIDLAPEDRIYTKRCLETRPVEYLEGYYANPLDFHDVVRFNDEQKEANRICASNSGWPYAFFFFKFRNPLNTTDCAKITWNGVAGNTGTELLAQSFQAERTGSLTNVRLLLRRSDDLDPARAGLVQVYVKSTLGSEADSVLAVSDSVSMNSIAPTSGWIDFPFSTAAQLTAGQTYYLELYRIGRVNYDLFVGDNLYWAVNNAAAYPTGQTYSRSAGIWSAIDRVHAFETYIDSTLDQAQTSSAGDAGMRGMITQLVSLKGFSRFYNTWEYMAFWRQEGGYDDITLEGSLGADVDTYYDPQGWIATMVHGELDGLASSAITADQFTVEFQDFKTAGSDVGGSYALSNLPVNDYTAVFEKPGYFPQTVTGTFVEGQEQTVDIQLTPYPPLVINITSPPNGTVVSTATTAISGTVTNTSSVTVNGLTTSVSNGTFTKSVNLVEGQNTITATATDQYGQTASDSITITMNPNLSLSVSTRFLHFGGVRTGESEIMELAVSNVSTTDLTVGTVIRPFAPFWIIADGCSGQVLAPSASCVIEVQCSPTADGALIDTMVIPPADTAEASITVTVTGKAWTSEGYRLPDTGQTDCYWGGNTSACSYITPEDGYYTINPPSYTVTGSASVTDNNTGLLWQQQNDNKTRTWSDALSYCLDLSLDGFTDWRLPTYYELMTIADYGQSNPAIDSTIFPNTQAAYYWAFNATPSEALAVQFENGTSAFIPRTSDSYTRCVRGAQLPQGNLINNGDDTITDKDSGLTWVDGYFWHQTWYTGLSACRYMMTDDGHADWRMPNIKELASYLPILWLDVDSTSWSSTTVLGPGYADAFAFDGQAMAEDKGINHFFKCVRGGNTWPKDAWTISVSPPALDYGAIEIGRSQTLSVTVSNTGTGDLVLGTITPPAAPYSLTTDGCTGRTLAAAASCTVTLEFAPAAGGVFDSSLIIYSNDADRPWVRVSMIGTGMDPNATFTGVVTNALTTQPVSSATVSIVDGLNKTHTAVTDVDGRYTIAGVSSGPYSGSITKAGYETHSFSGAVGYGQTVTLDAALNPILPVITSVNVSKLWADSAVITWTTDQQTDSLVEYGTTTAYGSSTSDAALTTSHSITLTNLAPQTTYHYRVKSTNTYGFSSTSADATFTTPLFTTETLGDHGSITVVEVSGNYDARNGDGTINDVPRQEIAKEFLRLHQDVYDFVVLYSNFDFAMPEEGAEAFYLDIANDTQGIGKTVYDNSAAYGSSGNLQGMIDMGNVANAVATPFDPAKFEDTLDTLAHELLHRWGAQVKFKNPDNTDNTSLLGKDGTHWSYLLDSDGSVLYGNDWKDNGDNTFTSVGTRRYYSALDLYLMGMLDKTQVPPLLLIENAAIDPAQLPAPGTTISGTAKTVTIDDIIAAEGARIPDASASPKTFKTAFLFIARPGTFTGAEPAGLEQIRNAWAGRFSNLTKGKGSMADVAPALSVVIGSPMEGATITRPEVTVTGAIMNSTGNETGVTVNGIPATVYGTRFVADHVQLAEGSNTITVTATDTAGTTATATMTVTAAAGNYISLNANIESGIAPLKTTMRIDGSFSIESSTLSATGPAQPEIVSISADEYTVTFTAEGVYQLTASVTGPDSITYKDTTTIAVLSRTEMDALLKAKWEGMKTKLAAQDVEGAVGYFSNAAKDKYRGVLNLLLPNLPTIVAGMQPINMDYIRRDVAEYRISRMETINAQNTEITYFIYFVKDTDGLWKIESL